MDSDDSKKSFLKHVFNFDDDSKNEVLNLIQYALLAIIPILLLNKGISKVIPEADEDKSSLEIVAELIIQTIIIFIGLLVINRIITFIPTYSGVEYPEINIVSIVLVTMMIILSLQTRIGEKANLLIERLVDLWDGKSEDPKKAKAAAAKKKAAATKQATKTAVATTAATNQYNDGTAIGSLPTAPTSVGQQQLPNYNNMYQQNTTPLVGAATPGGNPESTEVYQEPQAANGVLGGGFGSSW